MTDSLTSGSTGPRTLQGKQRSKYNATKHAIFSKVILLASESRAELNSLLEGLRECYRPQGSVDEILVDKLATQLWRYRRLLIAERAEIQRAVEFPTVDEDNKGKIIHVVVKQDGSDDGKLMQRIVLPEIRSKCLGLLQDLKAGISANGFDRDRDSGILSRLYGNYRDERGQRSLYGEYRSWVSKAKCSEEERVKNTYPSPEQCKSAFLEEVDEEIGRVERYGAIESGRAKLEAFREYVPNSSQPDRLLRYETSLDRSIDRTLAQLERHQRMRLGQPVPPQINLNVSSS